MEIAEGVAEVRIANRGPQLLVVDHREPSAYPDLAAIDQYNATLSYVLP